MTAKKKAPDSNDPETFLAVAARREQGTTLVQLAAELCCSVSHVRTLVERATAYREGMARLANDPQDIEGLGNTRAFGRGMGFIAHALGSRDVKRLSDLEEWSEAELRSACYLTPKQIEVIETTMAKHGLSLHPNRETPIERLSNYERERRANSWENRERKFILEQAKAVANIFCDAYHVLRNNRDDGAFFAIIAQALQQVPNIGNPVFNDLRRLEAEEKSAAKSAEELAAAVEARETATRRLVALTVEMGGAAGNVIRFPARLR